MELGLWTQRWRILRCFEFWHIFPSGNPKFTVAGALGLDARAILKGRLKNGRTVWAKWANLAAQRFPKSWMRAGFALMKIVHAFSGRETVLFEFAPNEAARRRVLPCPFRTPYIRSLYNEKIQSVGRTLRVPMDLK